MAYEWEGSSALEQVPLAVWPEFLNGISERKARREEQAGPVSEGWRDNHLTAQAGAMRRRGMSGAAILAALRVENAERCVPPLAESDVRRIARSVGRYPPGDNWGYGTGEGVPVDAEERRQDPAEQWPEPLGEAAFYGLAGEAVEAISPHTEADPIAILSQLLVSFGNAVGRNPYYVVESSWHYANLFCVLVGATSKGRKGTSWAHIRYLFAKADDEWTKHRVQSGLASGEGLIWAVRDPITRMERVGKGSDARYEEVQFDDGVSDKRLLAYEDEYASLLKVMTRTGNTLSPVIRRAWDTGNLNTMVKHNPAKATDAHISMVGHITKDELLRYLEATEMANGFANRFLFLCVRRARRLPDGGCPPGEDTDAIARELHKALQVGRKLCTPMERTPAARELWHEGYPRLSEDLPGMAGAITSRAEAQVLRISMQYALLDSSALIDLPHLEAALELWRYALDSVRYVFGSALGDPMADEILRALRAAGRDGMTRSDIRDLFRRHQSAENIGRALDTLRDKKLAACEIIQTGGRPTELWRAI